MGSSVRVAACVPYSCVGCEEVGGAGRGGTLDPAVGLRVRVVWMRWSPRRVVLVDELNGDACAAAADGCKAACDDLSRRPLAAAPLAAVRAVPAGRWKRAGCAAIRRPPCATVLTIPLRRSIVTSGADETMEIVDVMVVVVGYYYYTTLLPLAFFLCAHVCVCVCVCMICSAGSLAPCCLRSHSHEPHSAVNVYIFVFDPPLPIAHPLSRLSFLPPPLLLLLLRQQPHPQPAADHLLPSLPSSLIISPFPVDLSSPPQASALALLLVQRRHTGEGTASHRPTAKKIQVDMHT